MQWIAFALCFAAFPSLSEPSFSFNPEQIMEMFNAHLQEDANEDRIVSIKKTKSDADLILGDYYFKIGLVELKKMDLVNGRLDMRIKILTPLDAKGFVQTIIIRSTRGDPLNLFRGLGVITNFYQILNPQASGKESDAFIASLGLMRGDDDPTTGQPVSQLSKGAAFTCNTQQSAISTVFGCVISPRY